MITIIGAGKFGQTISKLLGKNKHVLVDIEQDGTYSSDTVEKIKKADKIIICVPSQALEDCLNMISGIINKQAQVLFCTKALYEGIKTPTEIARKYIENKTAALSGPNLSAEIMLGRPTMAGIAGDNAFEWSKLFDSPSFKTITEEHATVLEFGGAAKNIIALGTGLLDGYYENNTCNTMGSLVAFALKDIEHIFEHKHDTTIHHPSFIGDLFATCMSESSRNHDYGHKFGTAIKQGKTLPKIEQTVEGIKTLQTLQKFAEQNKIKIPTITAIYNTFFKKGQIQDIIDSWQ